MDCADAARVLPGCVLRRGIRVHRRCVQRLRARSFNPSRRHAGVRGYAARGEAPVTRCPRELYDRNAGCVRCATTWVRHYMRCPDPPLAARGRPWWAAALLAGLHASYRERSSPPPQKSIPLRLHKSMTRSRVVRYVRRTQDVARLGPIPGCCGRRIDSNVERCRWALA